ncbi:predicted protein [Histoplasma capsulatum H143]|uniref:Uncharacterized protein n=1 Tax=Ajellomyces capsulatus (strain H143) TaxID=544712 RepID=C6HBE0_AJECH|nr:predicted protein [Histoplasma capsulatum H143]
MILIPASTYIYIAELIVLTFAVKVKETQAFSVHCNEEYITILAWIYLPVNESLESRGDGLRKSLLPCLIPVDVVGILFQGGRLRNLAVEIPWVRISKCLFDRATQGSAHPSLIADDQIFREEATYERKANAAPQTPLCGSKRLEQKHESSATDDLAENIPKSPLTFSLTRQRRAYERVHRKGTRASRLHGATERIKPSTSASIVFIISVFEKTAKK